MRRIILRFSLVAALAALFTLSAVPAFAATASAHHASKASLAATGSCLTNPSDGTCDGVDPFAANCTQYQHYQGPSPSEAQVYWMQNFPYASACMSYYAWTYSPSGNYIQKVTLQRTDGKILIYCTAVARASSLCHGLSVNNTIPSGATSWYTDMLYGAGNNVHVQACVNYSPNPNNPLEGSYNCSGWH